ncbi:hypothetical protein A9P82_01695 [Arachidicoccus ginsenosidimutans]|uniref:TonB-dependent receptor n=1 Tax=Arachidicoccus sp. BS20 TaxID=1850526 RepID=UPI0007F06DC0|nr:TonB-dependent receptor [Arachidicoccus sp. BS20]ANI88137.1 hypothetical protein A9P82_01695 [Arachidicoccus sp. BS20]
MKHLSLLFISSVLCLLLTPEIMFAQSAGGAVRGIITTSDNKPASSITIQIEQLKRGAVSDNNGRYIINKLAPGHYVLKISSIGIAMQEKEIIVSTGETTEENFTINITSQQLQDVIVNTQQAKYHAGTSNDVAKMPLKNLENPQVYTTVTSALLKDQQIVTYSDALKNIPGVIMQLENNTAGGSVTSRGFPTQSFLRNGVVGIGGDGNIDVSNIESIEAIKGPSGALYGSSLISYGGLFNIVTKKPFDTFKGEAGYTWGGYGLSRFTVDVNTPLNADKTLLFRLNGAIHHEGSWQDAGFASYEFVAPSLTYKIDDKNTLELEGEYQNERANSFYRIFIDGSYKTGVRSPKDVNIDWHRRFIGNGLVLKPKQAKLFTTLTHQFSKQWVSRTNFTYLSSAESGGNAYMSVLAGNDSLIRNATYYDYYKKYTTDIQENINGDFHIGSLRNRTLIGAEVYSVTTKASYGSLAFDKLSLANPGVEYVKLSNTTLQNALLDVPFIQTGSILTNTYSAYVQNVLNVTDRLLAMASVRWDYYDYKGQKSVITEEATGGYHQNAFSPKFGLVYQIVKDKVSLFGNYMNGFTNVAPVQQPDGSTSVFKPQHANQWEGGVKADAFNGKLSGSISYYDIKVSNVVRSDAPDRPTYQVQNGTQYSKGLEAQVTANPFAGFNIIAGYAYNNSKYEKISTALDGFRPSSAGPKNLANAWLSYRVQTGTLQGLGLGFGGNYASENAVINDLDDYYVLPSFTTLNASLSYDKKKYNITCKVDNLTNKQYWVGWGTTIPQMPRRFSASFTVKF